MDPYIQSIGNSPSFQTTEDVRSMPSVQQPATTWQGREVTREEPDPVLEVLSNVHIMAQVVSLLPPADVARSTFVCPSFRAVKALIDLEQARSLALTFGFPKEFSFNIQGVPCRPLDESDPIVTRLIQIEQTLPKALRKNNSKEELRTLAQNPTWLRGFLQTAYDNQLLIALGEAAGIDPAQSFAQQVHHVRHWLDTSPQIMQLFVQSKDLLLLPKEVIRLSNLFVLSVCGSQITELPDVSPLTNLQELYLDENCLTALPNLSPLTQLIVLFARNNQLAELPNLSSLTNLRRLDVSRNQLTSLPELSSLTKLEGLNVWENQLTRLPDLSPLANLEQLYLDENRLTELPDLHSLVNLQILYANNTQITRLPDALFQLPQIGIIFARENPTLVIPAEQQPLIDAFYARGGKLV